MFKLLNKRPNMNRFDLGFLNQFNHFSIKEIVLDRKTFRSSEMRHHQEERA